TPAERVDRIAEVIAAVDAVAAQDEPAAQGIQAGGTVFPGVVQKPRPPILVAASGPRLLRLAAQRADKITFAVPPTATEEDVAAKVALVRDAAGDRFDELELAIAALAVGDELPGWMRGMGLPDPTKLALAGSVAVLGGSPREMADTLLRRRD